MQFELQQQKAKLANVNLRAELEGEDRRPACEEIPECSTCICDGGDDEYDGDARWRLK